MKINVTTRILNEKDEEVEETAFQTLRSVCCLVLYSVLKDDDRMTGDKKAEQAFLALRIQHEDEPELTAEQIAMLKDRIGKAASPLIVLRCRLLLEGKDQRPDLTAPFKA